MLLIPIFLFVLAGYIAAAIRSSRRYKHWPLHRYFLWVIGVCCAFAAVSGPLADRAHSDFSAHMACHLLLGMLSPLFLTLAAPITLLLRTLKVKQARRLTRILKSQPIRLASHPVTASLLNVGGLWILYTTDMYMVMHHNPIVQLLVHLHIYLAGWLFTLSLIYIEPTPHRLSFFYRAGVLVLAFASHGMLAKYLYVHPPTGVPYEQAEMGSMLMFYGGDVIEIALIYLFFNQWFRRPALVKSQSLPSS